MDNLNLALVSTSKPLMLGRVLARDATDRGVLRRKPFSLGRVLIAPHRCRYRVSALSSSRHGQKSVQEKPIVKHFASVSSSNNLETTSIGVNPPLSPPPSSTIGSPLFWIGVGVGLSALFSMVASRLKKYAMQQAFKTMMGQMNSQNNQFGNAAFSPGSPFPFSTPSAAGPTATAQPQAPSTSSRSQSTITVDVPATKVEATRTADIKDEVEVPNKPKKIAFVDVSPEETVQKSPFESVKDDESSSVKEKARVPDEVSQNGASFNQGFGGFPGSQSTKNSVLSVEALEKMMEDPRVQKMVYPYLPEEMRNPDTFKWMLQHPQYRQQLEEMLNNMGGGTEWDSQMMDTLKNFDLNSPQVKQQFDQIGLSPEEVVSKIMANPEVAMAFQNPRVQAAIMDCSQNPLNITKYQNDKEIMDVFNKISEIFPGVGSP
ncbi:protein TIC 40, chloroplastic [Vigna radiata var. radiata]|uniref:Protein TIC 40, chloroplastic n=1 Tax=Vigna radiata var. radiata TaxID=3916 RepID=A0A1S3VKE9_VIGRR|nr:protein TIC 40, chloroplastic [Vigna radiata var. radiata]